MRALIFLLALSACTPPADTPRNRAVIAAIVGASIARPVAQPQLNCYSTGAHAGVIATCY